MNTTIVPNSKIGDEWIRQAYAACPPQLARDKNGNLNGNVLTGPVRLSFTDGIFKKVTKMQGEQPLPDQSNMTYGCTILFPQITDMSIFWQVYCQIAQKDFPNSYNPQTGQFVGLVPPWRDQGEKQFDGYRAGSMFMNVKSKNYKPAVTDTAFNPIVNEELIYPGCWAIVALQPYAGGQGTPKKGPMFGLQAIVKIADDEKLGGGAVPPDQLFGGTNLTSIAPPLGGVAGVFAGMPNQQPQMPGMPGQQAVNQIMGAGYGQTNAPVQPPGFDMKDFM